MTENCDHEFGNVRTPDLELRNRWGTTRDNGLPKQVAGHATCEKCGENVPVDYNLVSIDGDPA